MSRSSPVRSLGVVPRRVWFLLGAIVVLLVCSVCLTSPLKASASGINKRKFTDAELKKIEEEWDENDADEVDDEEEAEKDQGPPPKSEMAFVSLKTPYTKSETNKWVGRVVDILMSGGVEVKGYAIDAARALFVCERGLSDLMRVRHYVLKQRSLVVDWEYNQAKVTPTMPRAGQTEAELDEELDTAESRRLAAGGPTTRFFPPHAAPPGMGAPPKDAAPKKKAATKKPAEKKQKKTSSAKSTKKAEEDRLLRDDL